jgi:hypothetical protein
MILLTACLGFAAYYALAHGYLKPLGLSGHVPPMHYTQGAESLQDAYAASYDPALAFSSGTNMTMPAGAVAASALPAPVFGSTIAEDSESLKDAYGDEYMNAQRIARTADAQQVAVAATSPPLPMVAAPYSAAPLSALGGYYEEQEADDNSCRSSCSAEKTPLKQSNCRRACDKSLGVEIATYDNKIDFLRLLPGQH